MRKHLSFNAWSALGLAGMLLAVLLGMLQATPPSRAANIAPRVWEDTAEGGRTDVLVIL